DAQRLRPRQLLLQPQALGDQHLVVAAAAGVDAAAGVAETFDQSCLDRRVAVLVALVERARTATEIVGERVGFAAYARQLVCRQDADALQAPGRSEERRVGKVCR